MMKPEISGFHFFHRLPRNLLASLNQLQFPQTKYQNWVSKVEIAFFLNDEHKSLNLHPAPILQLSRKTYTYSHNLVIVYLTNKIKDVNYLQSKMMNIRAMVYSFSSYILEISPLYFNNLLFFRNSHHSLIKLQNINLLNIIKLKKIFDGFKCDKPAKNDICTTSLSYQSQILIGIRRQINCGIRIYGKLSSWSVKNGVKSTTNSNLEV